MNYRMIANINGHIFCVEAAFMAPALFISLYHGEKSAVAGFAVAMAALALTGFLLTRLKSEDRSFYAREGFVTVGTAWILVSLFGALPFYISGAIPHFIDCIFEAVSGFTTTGATILGNVEALPSGILYWCSFTHWLGGMGVLVFILAIIPLAKNRGDPMHLLRAESPGVKVGKLVPRMRRSATILYEIYITLTLLQALLLLLGKIPLFDAVTIAFGTAGTGGFAIKNDSLASYSGYIQTVVTVFMFLFSINFNAFYLLLLREFRRMAKNEEIKVYLALAAISVLLIAANIYSLYDSLQTALHQAAFHVASAMSTTGFMTASYDLWPAFSKTILLLLMIVGSTAGSTGGGIKLVRAMLIAKAAKRAIYTATNPSGVKLIHMNGDMVEEETVSGVQTYLLLYVAITAISVLLVSMDNFGLGTNFSAVLACLNNIGQGFEIVGEAVSYSEYSYFSKLILSLDMLLGRLEIFPILALFAPDTWKK